MNAMIFAFATQVCPLWPDYRQIGAEHVSVGVVTTTFKIA